MTKKVNYPEVMYVLITEPSTKIDYGNGEAFESPTQLEDGAVVGEYKFVRAGKIESSSHFVPGDKR